MARKPPPKPTRKQAGKRKPPPARPKPVAAKPKRRVAKPPPPPPPKRPGRPVFVPTEQHRATVRVMVAGGIEQPRIARVIGISERSLRTHFRHEIDVGALEANNAVIAALFRMATAGTGRGAVTAAIWWTKTRMRWSEKLVLEGQGAFGLERLVEVLEARRRRPNAAE